NTCSHRVVTERLAARVPPMTFSPPDGRLLVVSGREGLLLRREPAGSMVTHADLTGLRGGRSGRAVPDPHRQSAARREGRHLADPHLPGGLEVEAEAPEDRGRDRAHLELAEAHPDADPRAAAERYVGALGELRALLGRKALRPE